MTASEQYLHEMRKATRDWQATLAAKPRRSEGTGHGGKELKHEATLLRGGCVLYRLNARTPPCAS